MEPAIVPAKVPAKLPMERVLYFKPSESSTNLLQACLQAQVT
jgi:hypothetical protein